MRLLLPAALCLALAPAGAQEDKTDKADKSDATAKTGEQAPPEFTDEIMNDAARQSEGAEIWQSQCRHCHGRSAYPGKAPKLKPRRYEPGFVYDRISNGFRKMPAWKAVYTQDQMMNIVAYIMSENFSP